MRKAVDQDGSSVSLQGCWAGRARACAWCLMVVWLGICVALVVLDAVQSLPKVGVTTYQGVFLGLSGLVVGLVIIFGVLPETRFGAPEQLGELNKEDTVKLAVKAGKGTLELRSMLAVRAEPPQEAPQGEGGER